MSGSVWLVWGLLLAKIPGLIFTKLMMNKKMGTFFLFWGQMLVQFFCLFSPNTLS